MPPILKHHVVPPDELDRLYKQHQFEEKIAGCRQIATPIQQPPLHETFCCTKRFIEFRTNDTDDELALIVEQAHRDPAKGTVRYIFRLRIDDDVYVRRLPS